MSARVVVDGLGFTEGPVALPDGRVALTSISHGCVYVVDPRNTASLQKFVTGGGPNGLAAGDDGALYVAQNGGIWGAPTKVPAGVQVIRDGRVEHLVEGMGAPNDLVVGPDGRLWVTDTVAEVVWSDPGSGGPGQVHVVDPHSGTARCVLDEGPVFTNGLAFDASGARLLLTATRSAVLWAYDVTDAGLAGPRQLVTFDGGSPDGMERAANGRFWVALLGADRLDLVDPEDGVVGAVPLPSGSLPTNVCRDHDGSGLFVTAGHAGALLHVRLGR
ncbi:SMP-30/gluconolactonase/LRE family protein [Nocardioides massiliensis]|uniref:Gluconolactonase n=1 Tax=Nocardioides massiliensis TaxID=1325935 RepID=A0ABT9NPC4_9ACTN|nr:SMP-30/gluconolactonase/LRE family protein [Nocardioides massiliensis]MDP9822274.1 gluconolactonase [Nocardioides massiliensis]